MKIRRGLVSNSSASSFTCDVCGETLTGWDGDYGDQKTYSCINDHNICEEDLLEEIDDSNESYDFDNDDVPERYCPVCQWQAPSHNDLSAFFLKEYKIPRAEVFEEVKKLNRRRKKLYNHEYTAHICQKFSLNLIDEVEKLKTRFKTYGDFLKFIKG